MTPFAVTITFALFDTGRLPPPWTTVSPPCGPGTNTVFVALAALGSGAPRPRVIVLPSAERFRSRQPMPEMPSIITHWPITKPLSFQDVVRVTVPPSLLAGSSGLFVVIVTGPVAVTGTSSA